MSWAAHNEITPQDVSLGHRSWLDGSNWTVSTGRASASASDSDAGALGAAAMPGGLGFESLALIGGALLVLLLVLRKKRG